jgi:2'-5' RNA ligase
MPRLFFALLPNDDTKKALQQLSTTLPLSTWQRTRAENWHITGNVNAATVPKIINATMPISTQAFTLVFDQLEFWRKKGIVCLTCSEPRSHSEPFGCRVINIPC